MKADERAGLELSKLSLGAYLRRWLDDSARPTVSPNTLRGYEANLIHLAPIADIQLQRLTPEHIERCCNAMTTHRANAKTQQPASPKTVRNVQVMLRRALGQAEQRGHIRRNPAMLVPLRTATPPTVEALTPMQAQAILAAIAGDRYEAAYALALVGLRSSEIRGLARSDLDLDDMSLTVPPGVGLGTQGGAEEDEDRGLGGDDPPAPLRRRSTSCPSRAPGRRAAGPP